MELHVGCLVTCIECYSPRAVKGSESDRGHQVYSRASASIGVESDQMLSIVVNECASNVEEGCQVCRECNSKSYHVCIQRMHFACRTASKVSKDFEKPSNVIESTVERNAWFTF